MPYIIEWMTANLTAVITAATILPALLAVYYQAKQARIAERELRRKVHDVAELASRLEQESNERKRLRRTQTEFHISQLNNYSDALNSTSQMHETVTDTSQMKWTILNYRINSLALAIRSVAKSSTDDSTSTTMTDVIEVCESLMYLIDLERLHNAKREQKLDNWEEDFDRAIDEVRKHDSSATRAAVEREQGRLKEINNQLNEEVDQILEKPLSRYHQAVNRLVSEIS